MASLRSIIEDREAVQLDGREFTWEQLYGSGHIREFAKGRTIAREATIKYGTTPGRNQLGYATYVNDVIEGVQFEDGAALLCATMNTFGGTFQSHDNIETWYLALTPKK